MDLQILYKDRDLLLVRKPAGVPSQPWLGLAIRPGRLPSSEALASFLIHVTAFCSFCGSFL